MMNEKDPHTQTRYKNARKKIRKKRKRRVFFRLILSCAVLAATFLCVLLLFILFEQIPSENPSAAIFSHAPQGSPILTEDLSEEIPEELSALLERNPETYAFVTEYPNRKAYLSNDIDLSLDRKVKSALSSGEVPLLMQWDLRWGYAPYGDDMIGLAGCGPTCLSMAYIALTGDASLHPAAMAEFAYEKGYYTESGTDWALWTDGVSLLGLQGETLTLSESAMRKTLDNGGLIICSMRPGDFTTTGHLILIRGYDEKGFFVNDPNCAANSKRQWSYDELSPQIKNLWGLQKHK